MGAELDPRGGARAWGRSEDEGAERDGGRCDSKGRSADGGREAGLG